MSGKIGFDSLLPEETPAQDASLTLHAPGCANSKANAGASRVGRLYLVWRDGLGGSLPAGGPGGSCAGIQVRQGTKGDGEGTCKSLAQHNLAEGPGSGPWRARGEGGPRTGEQVASLGGPGWVTRPPPSAVSGLAWE